MSKICVIARPTCHQTAYPSRGYCNDDSRRGMSANLPHLPSETHAVEVKRGALGQCSVRPATPYGRDSGDLDLDRLSKRNKWVTPLTSSPASFLDIGLCGPTMSDGKYPNHGFDAGPAWKRKRGEESIVGCVYLSGRVTWVGATGGRGSRNIRLVNEYIAGAEAAHTSHSQRCVCP